MSMSYYGTLYERPLLFSCRQAPYCLREPVVWVPSMNEKIWQ